MICLPYANPDSFGCDNCFQTSVDIACLVSLPTSKTDVGRLTGKHQASISPSAALLARHHGNGGDASFPSPSPVGPKSDLGRLTAKHQFNVFPSTGLKARHDSIGSDASSLSSLVARVQYISHAWSRNMGFVCACTSSEQIENVLTSAQRASLEFQNKKRLDAIEVSLLSENHISGVSSSEQTFFSRSSTMNDAFGAQASGITEDTQCSEPLFHSTKRWKDQSYEASLAEQTRKSRLLNIKPWEGKPSCEPPADTPGLSTIDSGAMLSAVTLETKNVKGFEIQASQTIEAAQVRGMCPSLDRFPLQGKESGSYFLARVQDAELAIDEDQDHFRDFRQMSEAAQYSHVESDGSANGCQPHGISSHAQDGGVAQHSLKNEGDGFENGYGSHGISSHAQEEHDTQLSLKNGMDGSSYVVTAYPESQTVLKETYSAREEDTVNISVVRLPAYRTSYSKWSSKFTESIFYLESMGVDTGKIIREEPAAVTYDIIRLRELVRSLEVLGLHWNDLGKIFNLCPKIFHLSPEKDFKLITGFLFDEAGLSPKDFSKVIKRCPRLLACDVANQLFPTLTFLRTLGFSNMGQVIANNATLLSLNVEKNLIPKLNYLESLGFTHRQAVSMVARFPALFNYKVKDNLEPKYEYLVHEIGGSNRDLLAFPQYFGYSLVNRIIPRHQCIAKLNVALSIQAMLRISEAEFYARFQSVCELGPSSKQETSGANVRNCALESAEFDSLTYPRTIPSLVGAQR